MIGLRNLPDGGHVLEHPAGPLYVRVKDDRIVHAELAPWGEAQLVTWRSPRPSLRRIAENAARTAQGRGGDAAAQV